MLESKSSALTSLATPLHKNRSKADAFYCPILFTELEVGNHFERGEEARILHIFNCQPSGKKLVDKSSVTIFCLIAPKTVLPDPVILV